MVTVLQVVGVLISSCAPSRLTKRPSRRVGGRLRVTKGGSRSLDLLNFELGIHKPCQSSSDLSSPNETCYSFVRRAIQVKVLLQLLRMHVQDIHVALQKFSSGRRQIGGSAPFPTEEEASSDASNLSRFAWFTLASLGHFSSSLVLEREGEDGIEEAALVHEDDSGESGGESIGDLPIELRHLESDFEDLPVDEEELQRFQTLKLRQQSRFMYSLLDTLKSKSLDDLSGALEDSTSATPKIKVLGRANTYDEGSCLKETPAAESSGQGFLKDIKSTLSTSLKSIDLSIRSGSLTSVSSGKSLASVQSDSGMGIRSRKHHHLGARRKEPLGPQDPQHRSHVVPKILGARSWESEPFLRQSESSSRMSGPGAGGEKEKSKVMQSVESKLMKAIKEVNETDECQNNSGSSMDPAKDVLQDSADPINEASSDANIRPMLVKQKKSFHFLESLEGMEYEQEDQKKSDEPKKSCSAPRRPSAGVAKQASLTEELLSRERVLANAEAAREARLRKQLSLPCEPKNVPGLSLRERLLVLVAGRTKEWTKSQEKDQVEPEDQTKNGRSSYAVQP